jgi:hypothetical protein
MKYSDLVSYIKENHIDWNTDIFDVLKDFFNQYSNLCVSEPPIQQEIIFPSEDFKKPEDGEYSINDLLNLLQ